MIINLSGKIILKMIEWVREEVKPLTNWAGLLRGRSSNPYRFKNFLYSVQTGSGAHPASYPMGTEGKAAGA
jgi:hypothetical protein